MPAPISPDLRARAVEAWEGGEGTQRGLAKRFKVGESSIGRWVGLKRDTGSVEPVRPARVGRARLIDEAGTAVLAELVAMHSDATEEELTDLYAERTGQNPSRSTIHRALKRLGYTRKKSAS